MNNIELSRNLQLLIMVLSIAIASIIFFSRKKKLDYSYIPIIIVSLTGGASFYAGLLWILKAFNIILDNNIFNEPVYNLMMGAIAIVFTIISIRDFIETQK